jgi:hypothetical protein
MPFLIKDPFNRRIIYSYMTVGELMEELKKYPPEIPIVHEYDSSWGWINKPKILDSGYPLEEIGVPQGTKLLWINPTE